MCTALSMNGCHHYFGRTLDIDYKIDQNVIIIPRKYPFHFRNCPHTDSHYSIIGAASMCDRFPLYYDAINEAGLGIAGLNFYNSAKFCTVDNSRMYNIETFELIPWILSQCDSVTAAKKLLNQTNILGNPFNQKYDAAPLHWIISDKFCSITLESVAEGIMIYENQIGILTNEPPFSYHTTNLNNYINITASVPKNRFSKNVDIQPYSNGMGALGLPGDMSSASRFIRAAFAKSNSVCELDNEKNISQFFHVLGTVEQVCGCVEIDNGRYEKTIYTCCCDTDECIYYYTTYENRQITAIDMRLENLDSSIPIIYPMSKQQHIFTANIS